MAKPDPSEFLTMEEARDCFPGRPKEFTLRRWVNVGVGGVKLQAERSGGKLYTTKKWCAAFHAAVNAARPA